MKYFNCGEVQKILNVTANRKYRLLYEFLFRSGARISEALALTSSDIDHGHVRIRCLKKRGRDVIRLVPIEPDFMESLRRKEGRIFKGSRQNSQKVLKRSMALAGFHPSDKRSHHAFRHGFAKTCLDQGVDLRDLQRYLGHSSIAITSNYLSITEEYLTRLHRVKFLQGNQLTLMERMKA